MNAIRNVFFIVFLTLFKDLTNIIKYMLTSLQMIDINNTSIITDLQEGIENRFMFPSSLNYIADSGKVKKILKTIKKY